MNLWTLKLLHFDIKDSQALVYYHDHHPNHHSTTIFLNFFLCWFCLHFRPSFPVTQQRVHEYTHNQGHSHDPSHWISPHVMCCEKVVAPSPPPSPSGVTLNLSLSTGEREAEVKVVALSIVEVGMRFTTLYTFVVLWRRCWRTRTVTDNIPFPPYSAAICRCDNSVHTIICDLQIFYASSLDTG